MEKKIPIDKLFHDQLADGREQLNLGAWANMERMLEGKNPYAGEDERKRRGLFPLFIALLVGLAITGTTFLIRQNLSKTSSPGKTAAVTQDAASSNAEQAVPSSLNQDVADRPDEMNKTGHPEKSHARHNAKPAIRKAPTAIQTAVSHTAVNNEQTAPAGMDQTSTSTNEAMENESRGRSEVTAAIPNPLERKTKKSKIRVQRDQQNDLSVNQQDIASAPDAISPGNEAPQPLNKLVRSIPMVTVNQKAVMGRNGKLEMRNDTVDRSTFNQEIEVPARPQLDWTQTNPRFKALNAEEEFNAAYHREPLIQETQAQTGGVINTTARNAASISSTNEKVKHEQGSGIGNNIIHFASRTFEKVNNILLYKAKPDIYTALLMGVNTSLNSSKNNFGGFQGGLSFLRPVSDYLSFITECKFYYRKNGGYTANDIYYNILDPHVDSVSLGHIQQTVYSYQKDSIIKTYNFKNFYSFEMPLMMQFNYHAFAVYGGVNLAYSLRLNTTEKSRNYVNTFHDTVQNAAAYSFPVERASQYTRSDFASRFGVGYTVGASFSFSPQLYLDLRVAQNVWDNARTNSARELSSGFFKVPSIQFSLGYRFRNFTPDN